MNQRWGSLCQSILSCKRTERLRVIALLDDEVEEEYISQETADAMLTEWDVANWPEQMPAPLVEHVREKNRTGCSILSHSARIEPELAEVIDIASRTPAPPAEDAQ